MSRLYIMNGPLEGQSFELEAHETAVGRDPDNDVQIIDPAVSGRHIKVIQKSGQYLLEDLKSRNGTWINGRLLESGAPVQVNEGQPVIIGQTLMSIGRAFSGDIRSEHLTYSDMELESDLSRLAVVREFIRKFCREHIRPAVDEEWVWQLNLAVNEAAANIIRHAYQGRSDHRIHVEAELFIDRIAVRLDHQGAPFEPPEPITLPPPEEYQEGGYGLFLIEKSVDEVTYLNEEDGRNSICLVKYRDWFGKGGTEWSSS